MSTSLTEPIVACGDIGGLEYAILLAQGLEKQRRPFPQQPPSIMHNIVYHIQLELLKEIDFEQW